MPKGLRLGVQNLSQNGKKGYFGVSDVAEKIKKIYVGDSNGIAQIGYSAELKLIRVATKQLSWDRTRLAATSIDDKALFGGGYRQINGTITYRAEVDVFDSSLTRASFPNLNKATSEFSATTVGNYALFGGGYYNGDRLNTVTAYDKYGTSTVPTTLSVARAFLSAASHTYALFAGGVGNGSARSAVVDTYDTSLTHGTASNLQSARGSLEGITLGNHVLFGGGQTSSSEWSGTDVVDTYDTSLTHTTLSTLVVAVANLAATCLGNYALFGGGGTSSSPKDNVTAYDVSLTRLSADIHLHFPAMQLSASTIGTFALFAGGRTTGSSYSSWVSVLDASLTSSYTSLTSPRLCLAGTSTSKYALFGGGEDYANSQTYSQDTVDVFEVA